MTTKLDSRLINLMLDGITHRVHEALAHTVQVEYYGFTCHFRTIGAPYGEIRFWCNGNVKTVYHTYDINEFLVVSNALRTRCGNLYEETERVENPNWGYKLSFQYIEEAA